MPVELGSITFPAPEPYDPAHPERNRENLAYLLIQVLDRVVQGQETLDLDIVEAVRGLQFNHATIRWGDVEIILTNTATSVSSF